MRKHRVIGAAVVAAAIAAGPALAATVAPGGTIRFTGRIVEDGFSMQTTPRVANVGAQGVDAKRVGDALVVAFHSAVSKPVPAEVSVTAPQGAADLDVRYDGFRAGHLAGEGSTLTLARHGGSKPVLAVVQVTYL